MKRKTLNKIIKLFLGIFVFSIFYGALYLIFATNFVRINSFELVGSDDRYKEQILTSLNNSLSKKAFLIPTNNLLTYRSSVFEKDIKNILTNTKEVKVRPSSLNTLRISIEKHQPVFKTQVENMAMEENGFIYKEINDISNLPMFVSSSTQNKETINKMSNFIQKVDSVLFKVDLILIDEYGDIYLKNNLKGSYVVFKLKDDLEKLWITLLSAIETNPIKESITAPVNNLEYIDVRFGNKVFYKFTNSTHQDIIATSTNNYETSSSTRVLAEPNR